MPDIETKPKSAADIRKEARKAEAEKLAQSAAELESKRQELKTNIGKSFGTKTVVGFYPDKILGAESGDAFLINSGNKHRSDFVFCDEFLAENKGKE